MRNVGGAELKCNSPLASPRRPVIASARPKPRPTFPPSQNMSRLRWARKRSFCGSRCKLGVKLAIVPYQSFQMLKCILGGGVDPLTRPGDLTFTEPGCRGVVCLQQTGNNQLAPNVYCLCVPPSSVDRACAAGLSDRIGLDWRGTAPGLVDQKRGCPQFGHPLSGFKR